MSRTTTDPKPHLIALRLGAADLRALARLARKWKCSRGEVLRRLLREAAEKKATR